MTVQKSTNGQTVKLPSYNRDTDADGLPDRIDSQYSYPPAEQAKRTKELRSQQAENSVQHKPRKRGDKK